MSLFYLSFLLMVSFNVIFPLMISLDDYYTTFPKTMQEKRIAAPKNQRKEQKANVTLCEIAKRKSGCSPCKKSSKDRCFRYIFVVLATFISALS